MCGAQGSYDARRVAKQRSATDEPSLEELLAFVRIAQQKSFTAAARSLGVPKSTLSRRISRLEHSLDARLFQRTTRQLRLTEAGHTYLARVAPAVTGIEEAARCVREQQQAPAGLLRVTAPTDLGVYYLGVLIAEFRRTYKRVTFDVLLTDRFVDLVGEGFDVAIRATRRLADSSLVARRVGSVRVQLFASPAYLRENGTPRTPAELASHTLVPLPHHRVAGLRLVGSGGAVGARVAATIVANDILFAKSLALAGGGIALLPARLCQDEIRDGRLVRVLPTHHGGDSNVFVVYPGADPAPARHRLFVEFLATRLSSLLAEEVTAPAAGAHRRAPRRPPLRA